MKRSSLGMTWINLLKPLNPGLRRAPSKADPMKKFVVLLILLAVGYYLYQGPLAPLIQAGEFPLKVLKEYEDTLMVFRGSKGSPKKPPPEGTKPYRKGKVVVLDSAMHLEPRLQSAFFDLDEKLRAANPDEVGTVVIVHFVAAADGGLGAPNKLYWGSFEWPSGKCLGFELVKTWPRTYGRADIKDDYPDFGKKIKSMKAK
jgi:hypothetical protein